MKDEELQRFYERAAHDEAFREALWSDPDGAIDSTDLPPHVKAMLKSVSLDQLAVMVRKATGLKAPLWARIINVVVICAIAALAVALLLPSFPPTRKVSVETRAAGYLHEIGMAQAQYYVQYGTFGTIDDLSRSGDGLVIDEELLSDDFPYEFTITVDGETFTATARHRTRPDTRKAFIVGPDGEVKELKDDDSVE